MPGAASSSHCCRGQPLPLPLRCWDQEAPSKNLESPQLLLSCLRKEHEGKSVSSQEQQGPPCVPLGTSPPHSGQGRPKWHSRHPKPTLSLSSHSTKDELPLLTGPGCSPCIHTRPGGGSKTQPHSRDRAPELNPACQCHLGAAAHSSATCTVPGEPGSSSVPTSHPAGTQCHPPTTAGRDGAEHTNTAGLGSLIFICTLCPARSPNPNVGGTPRA